MRSFDNIKITEVENYLNTIFDLKSKIRDKDFRIAILEFELLIEKQLLGAFKEYYMQETVN